MNALVKHYNCFYGALVHSWCPYWWQHTLNFPLHLIPYIRQTQFVINT